MMKSIDYLKEQRHKREIEGTDKRREIESKMWDRYVHDQTLNEF